MQQTAQAPRYLMAALATLCLAAMTNLSGAANAQGPEPELGVWYNHSGKGAVEIYRCQQNQERLCGRIVWLKTQTYDNGEPLLDRRNSKASLRNRTICGLPVLGNLAAHQGGGWNKGWVYDPEKGSTFGAAIRANATGNALTLTGSQGIFWKTFTWNRAPDDLPRCSPLE